MTIKVIKYFLFSLPFKKIFTNSKTNYHKKVIFILEAKDDFGNITYGEVSTHLNTQNLDFIEDELNKIIEKEFFFSNDIDNANQQIKNLPLNSSIVFALEQIYLNFLFINNKINSRFIFNKNFQNSININAVVGIDETQTIFDKLKNKFENGYKTFKIKVGRKNFRDDLLLIEKIDKLYSSKIKIRVDANGKWNLEEAKKYLSYLGNYNIEYIEEPCALLIENLELAEITNINIALDESLKNANDVKDIIKNNKIKFIVIKPFLHFGILDTIKLIDLAESENKNIIISSNFESPIGKSALFFLAAYTSHNFAHGLDTTEFFNNTVCEDYYKVSNGKINFDLSNFPPKYKLEI